MGPYGQRGTAAGDGADLFTRDVTPTLASFAFTITTFDSEHDQPPAAVSIVSFRH